MDNSGRMVTINQEQGVYWGGLWLSNTYAWSASASASDKPINSTKEAKKQVKEKPVKYAPLAKSYAYGSYHDGEWYDSWGASSYRWEDGADYDRKQSYFADDYEIVIEEFGIMGLFNAQSLTFREADDFAQRFDEGAFFDLAYSCLDGDIDEQTFIKCMTDHNYARECFPFLNRLSDLSYANDQEVTA